MSRADGFPPIADYGFLSDRRSAALVARDGSIDWCCLPRIDAASCFGRLLDRERGGHCAIAPTRAFKTDRSYVSGSLVLETVMRTDRGELRLTDLMALEADGSPDGQGRLLRIVEGLRGSVRVRFELRPRFDYGDVRPWIRRVGPSAFTAIGGDDGLVIWSDAGLEPGRDHDLTATRIVRGGDRLRLSIAFARPHELEQLDDLEPPPEDLDRIVERTVAWWARWTKRCRASGPRAEGVTRSAIVLEGLTSSLTGAIAAAATTSLPEAIGGQRNWDYRFSWVRDSALAVRALVALGYEDEADRFRRFIQRSAAGHVDDLQIAYGVEGERRIGEMELDHLTGYRGSRPVRVGNGAAGQNQLDVLGELMLMAWRWHRRGASPDDDLWRFLTDLANAAAERWSRPDSGIWERREQPQHFVHSKVMCWATLDRALALADECLRTAPVRRWKRERDRLAAAIERRGVDRRRGVFVRAFGSRDMDAALLLIPHTGYVDAADERMVRTVDAIREELEEEEGIVRRYRADDGLGKEEGAFLACSFWLAECLARQGRAAEAEAVFDRAAATANDLGLFSEELDPGSGAMLGNFPQALTHLSHIAAAVALERAAAGHGERVSLTR
jgi:GH15 family glucan-1,4-alpha-glucosidase